MESHVRAGTVFASLLWFVGVALVLGAMFTRVEVGDAGVLVAGCGGVLQIRGFIYTQRDRERDAFELGRAAATQNVKRLR